MRTAKVWKSLKHMCPLPHITRYLQSKIEQAYSGHARSIIDLIFMKSSVIGPHHNDQNLDRHLCLLLYSQFKNNYNTSLTCPSFNQPACINSGMLRPLRSKYPMLVLSFREPRCRLRDKRRTYASTAAVA